MTPARTCFRSCWEWPAYSRGASRTAWLADLVHEGVNAGRETVQGRYARFETYRPGHTAPRPAAFPGLGLLKSTPRFRLARHRRRNGRGSCRRGCPRPSGLRHPLARAPLFERRTGLGGPTTPGRPEAPTTPPAAAASQSLLRIVGRYLVSRLWERLSGCSKRSSCEAAPESRTGGVLRWASCARG